MLRAISQSYRTAPRLSGLRHRFARRRILVLDDLLTPSAFGFIADEAHRLRDHRRHRRFQMEEFESWRDMSVIGGDPILEYAPGLGFLYGHADFQAFLEGVVDDAVYPCEESYEWCVINHFDGRGTTQGWHLDDTAFVLILMLDESVSRQRQGGALECRLDWPEYRREQEQRGVTAPTALIGGYAAPYRQDDLYLQRGQVCLMRGDQVMHRVSPIQVDGHRHTLLMSWQHQAHVPRDGTGVKLYT